MGWSIQRRDGTYYAGTADRDPVWTAAPGRAARFDTRDEAEQRARGLRAEGWRVRLIHPEAVC
jgi:hypothetical protein